MASIDYLSKCFLIDNELHEIFIYINTLKIASQLKLKLLMVFYR